MSATTEAQRLYSISLTKIARSRTHRGGVSLHKNLLVATVLQKARFQIYMEDVHHIWQTNGDSETSTTDSDDEREPDDEDTLLNPTSEEYVDLPPSPSDLCTPADDTTSDKENQLPSSDSVSEPTYLDLDSRVRETGTPTINVVLRERSNCDSPSLKRRHAISEWETEEAILSILPKRVKKEDNVSSSSSTSEDDVFSANSESTSSEEDDGSTSMEIDRITSLVSIFSFGGLALESGSGKLTRTVSTPDLCSAQAKECSDSLQQRPAFLAMTV